MAPEGGTRLWLSIDSRAGVVAGGERWGGEGGSLGSCRRRGLVGGKGELGEMRDVREGANSGEGGE